jgi:tetratricopeptide (TPR) repeat protein
MAASQLDLANREADRGNYTGALEQLEDVWRLALSVDDPPLLIKAGLARGNALLGLGRTAEADTAWDAALAEAERAGEAELGAVCRVYQARGLLLTVGAAAEVRDRVSAALGQIRTDKLSAALAQTVLALAEKDLGRYAEAEEALNRALTIHLADRQLELAAYDWYLIGSVRSVAGRYDRADEALVSALSLDRRAENSHGIGMDWMARGDVALRAGRSADALAAYRRAADVFAAAGFALPAAEAESRYGAARGKNTGGE